MIALTVIAALALVAAAIGWRLGARRADELATEATATASITRVHNAAKGLPQ